MMKPTIIIMNIQVKPLSKETVLEFARKNQHLYNFNAFTGAVTPITPPPMP